MPVPTETFRSTAKLNAIFAATAVALLASVLWMVFDDYNRQFRRFQRQGRLWEIAMTLDEQVRAGDSTTSRKIKRIESQISQVRLKLEQADTAEQITRLDEQITDATASINRLSLPTASLKGRIGPFEQQIQNALLENPVDVQKLIGLKDQLFDVQSSYDTNNQIIVQLEQKIASLESQRGGITVEQSRLSSSLSELTRQLNGLTEKLDKLDPPNLWAKLGDKVRDAPLLDWLNPNEKPRQVVVPLVKTDLNTHLIETIDRCHSCHVNIDKPAFGEANVLTYAEHELAVARGQDVEAIGDVRPVVMLDFWIQAAGAAGPAVQRRLEDALTAAVESFNEVRRRASQEPLEQPEDLAEVAEMLALQSAQLLKLKHNPDHEVSLQDWIRPVSYLLADVKAVLADHMGAEQFKRLRSLYRHELLRHVNAVRKARKLPALAPDSSMLAHPRLDLYVNPESAHPMKSMGCTVCHEGSGQETIFEHTVHSPRAMWVDAKSGAPIPDMLIRDVGDARTLRRKIRSGPTVVSGKSDRIALASHAVQQPAGASVDHHDPDHAGTIHDGINLNREHAPAPFAPDPHPHGDAATYVPLGGDEPIALAVRQQQFWKKTYGWTHVHYMHWEKPMHTLDHIESSCNKCHTEVHDLRDEAPRLVEGRRLFASQGCVNCHAVTSLEDDLDIRRVGPSLVHVKHKLSQRMIANWVWAPKALRPTTRMPHYFMLENNSSPLDILRTRVEVAAIAHYLANAQPGPSVADDPPVYAQTAPPAEPADAERGRILFHQVGCLACHSNMNESGRKWITQDLTSRLNLSNEDAAERYEAMSVNQRHQHVLVHAGDKLQRTGPELSGVGTKLLVDRTPQQARAWLFNWLLNPRNYHSYTIMPSLRLSEQEAADISEYLLAQQRDDYETSDFTLDDDGHRMLEELVVSILGAQSTPKMAREQVDDQQKWGPQRQLNYLGGKVITHYGCNGCHVINGFEQAVSACTKLDDWGLKDPHKLDFGHFEHAFDHVRDKPWSLPRVKRGGLSVNATHIDAASDAIKKDVPVQWEHIENERRPWLYHKLHNTRIYDRGRTGLDGKATDDGGFDVGRPYDKLKMPHFFLTDEQVRALVTYVTSIRKPLVERSLQNVGDDAGRRVTRGRQIAERYNCYGCHNIDGNDVHMHQYLQVHNEDGSYNDDALNWAPPRLLGQGAKTQPDWLYTFLQNVRPIRPWLRIRMPSFPMTDQEARGLVDYFAGHSEQLATGLDDHVQTIDRHRVQLKRGIAKVAQRHEQLAKSTGEADLKQTERELLAQERADLEREKAHLERLHAAWFDSAKPAVHAAVEKIEAFATAADLVVATDLDSRHREPKELHETWNGTVGENPKTGLLDKVRTLVDSYRAPYPYTTDYRPELTESDPETLDARFELGRRLYVDLGCMTGLCHRVGDEHLLARHKMLVMTSLEDTAADGDEEGYDDEGYDEEGDDDEEGYEDDEDEAEDGSSVPMRPEGPPGGAPNLRMVAERLQDAWVKRWLAHSGIMQPGTRMQQYFPEGASHYKVMPPDVQKQKEELFGNTAEGQKSLLIDFLYSIGPRRLTLAADGSYLAAEPAKQTDPEAPEPPQAEAQE